MKAGDDSDSRKMDAASEAFASSIERIASEWLVRREAGLDPSAETDLKDWLAANPRHAAVFSRLADTREVFERAQRKGVAAAIVTKLEIRARKRRRSRLLAAASAALLMAGAAWLGFPPQGAQTAPPVASRRPEPAFEPIRKLPDGSIVEMKTGAEIVVEYETGFRCVRLVRGEALFRVEKDTVRPFLVRADGVEVRAVGTAFSVQLETHAVEVMVTEGRVTVETAPSLKAVSADAGSSVIVDTRTPAEPAARVQALTQVQIEEHLAWRIPRLEFAGTSLLDAAASMNRQNRLQIVLGDPSIGSLRISGVFRPDNPEGFVGIVTKTFGLKAEVQNGSRIVLSRDQ